MPAHQIVIPALPTMPLLGVLAMVVTCAWLHGRGLLSAPRVAAGWFAGWYAVAVVGATMLPMPLTWGSGTGGPELFRFLLLPVLDMRPMDFVLNTVMMLPLGTVLHTVFGVRGRRRVVLTGFLVSLTIELTQAFLILTLHGNRWADVNDLMSNTLGTFLGYLVFQRLMRSARFHRAVESCSFPRSARETSAAVR
ncbi:VanZ family protein [Actinoplanes rectilineatus]|uniref:VanZ family protein n=1 Tax=Actinoplanes rectilineatus TaxID=113571 RepID=UPI0009FB88FB|nr:VanZ family protein [Actinoplanes rectilineatus]